MHGAVESLFRFLGADTTLSNGFLLLVAALAVIWIPIANNCNAKFDWRSCQVDSYTNTLTIAVTWTRNPRDTLGVVMRNLGRLKQIAFLKYTV